MRDTNGPDLRYWQSPRVRRFIGFSAVIFFLLLTSFTAIRLAPTGVIELNNAFFSLFVHDENENGSVEVLPIAAAYAEPVRIAVSKISLDGTVVNPRTQDVTVLDQALLKGAVRYPGSGDLESAKNIFIFGHSSELPVVHNQSFKIFNRLKELNIGDAVSLYSTDKQYRYKVSSVSLASAEDALVNFKNEHKLVLSTCNTFGKKQERFVVYADFVGSRALVN